MMRRLSGAFVAVLLLALSSSLVFAKPPDLPQNPTITVSDQPETVPQDGLRALMTSSLFFNVDPLIADPPPQDEAASTPNEADFSCPGFCCGCCCAWLEQFGLCWISQLQQWCKSCYSSDPNQRILETLNTSEDLRQIEAEWERIWFEDQPAHLTPERIHGGIQAVPEQKGEGQTESACDGSACPKCEALHAQYVARHAKCAGTDEQVSGLMKACYLAIGEGRFAKAAELAREAYALDAGRVEGDPLIYKMQLLTGKSGCCPCKKGGCGHECEQIAPFPSDPLQADLPCWFHDVVPVLDDILMGKDELGKKGP